MGAELQQKTQALIGALEQAEELLAYAATRGIPIPDSTIQTIIKSKALPDKNLFKEDYDGQAAFWKARQDLAKAVAPVSPESLKQSTEAFPDRRLWSRFKARILHRPVPSVTRAALTVRKMYCWALTTLILLIIFQVYTVIGSSLVSDIQQYLSKVNANRVEQAKITKAKGEQAADNQELQDLEAEEAQLEVAPQN